MSLFPKRLLAPLLLVATVGGITGCVTEPDSHPDFGEALWHTKRAVTEGGAAAAGHRLDGERSLKVMQNYREDVGSPEDVEQVINITVNE